MFRCQIPLIIRPNSSPQRMIDVYVPNKERLTSGIFLPKKSVSVNLLIKCKSVNLNLPLFSVLRLILINLYLTWKTKSSSTLENLVSYWSFQLSGLKTSTTAVCLSFPFSEISSLPTSYLEWLTIHYVALLNICRYSLPHEISLL